MIEVPATANVNLVHRHHSAHPYQIVRIVTPMNWVQMNTIKPALTTMQMMVLMTAMVNISPTIYLVPRSLRQNAERTALPNKSGRGANSLTLF
jgi:hypothetical protein